ncbi:MAG: translation initiation factor IF-2, partial [Bacteroides sp.]|nr:translation initiation factor IF-2 [Bacteroides sp.]
EEKEKARVEQRKIYKDAFIKDLKRDENKSSVKQDSKQSDDANAKKKRNRIRGEKVDINSVVHNIAEGQKKQDNKFRAEQGSGNKKNKDRFKKQPVKQEISEEDVAKQVKETLARLTSKGKNKAAKYRKEKREMVSNRMQELEDLEMAESKVLKLTEFVTANELATMMNVSVNQVISTCMSIGMMVSINQRLDAETINIVADEFGFKTEYVSAEVSQAIVEEEDSEEDLLPRAPIVTVMGHVDHGKTSLLDYIRKANVIAGEAGGITQHIGAYNVKLEDGRRITFLDTPGHEAFTAMRARGAKVTDIAIIIVAADDSVMPQTKEAINHAMAANVPIVFAINKVDKPTANPDKIKEELANMNFLVEDWGGKYQSQDISAKSGLGVSELMEKVLLEAELLELKANPNRNATGSVIESSLDKGRGYVSTVLVSNGTLKIGDIVLAGSHYGRVKAMFNERNQRIKESKPSEPALILGLNGAPAAGDTFHVVATDQEAREITNKREQLAREQGLRTQKILTLDELGRRIALGNFQELNIIVKADVDGSVEALSDSLIKLSTEQIQVNVIHKGVGQISESDVSLAAASNAIIVGFQVRPSGGAAKMAEQEGVDIRKYSIIYDAIEEVKSAMEGMLAPELKEQVTATIEVREVYNITKVGIVAGAMVKTGKVKRSDKARLIRDGIVIFTGNINALKRFKDDVKEVGTNFECGISLVSCNDIKVGDVIETFEEIEVKQTL